MGLINYEQLEDNTPAVANGLNERFGRLHDVINGNIDAANMENEAVTTPKIADRAVTSAKLGFEKKIDDNGWLITDLGLVKLATKKRNFTVGPTPAHALATQVTWDDDAKNAPVGFNPNSPYSVNYSVSMQTNEAAYGYTFNTQETDGNVLPNFTLIAMNRTGVGRDGDRGSAVTWVVF